jgi:hypothetical protein
VAAVTKANTTTSPHSPATGPATPGVPDTTPAPRSARHGHHNGPHDGPPATGTPRVVDQRYEMVPVDGLRLHPENPRRGRLDVIGESIAANGFWGAVVAQRSTGYVLAGNHRLRAALAAGIDELPVVWVDVDDDRARRILLADNRTADLAVNDNAALLALLEGVALTPAALAGTGYDPDTMEDLRAMLDVVPAAPPMDTFAHYAETPEEEAARAAARAGGGSIHSAGLRELVLVFPADEHAALLDLVGILRPAVGPDATTSDLFGAALRLAAEHPDELVDFRVG